MQLVSLDEKAFGQIGEMMDFAKLRKIMAILSPSRGKVSASFAF